MREPTLIVSLDSTASCSPRLTPISSSPPGEDEREQPTPAIRCLRDERRREILEGRLGRCAPSDRIDDQQVREGPAQAATGDVATHAPRSPNQGAPHRIIADQEGTPGVAEPEPRQPAQPSTRTPNLARARAAGPRSLTTPSRRRLGVARTIRTGSPTPAQELSMRMNGFVQGSELTSGRASRPSPRRRPATRRNRAARCA